MTLPEELLRGPAVPYRVVCTVGISRDIRERHTYDVQRKDRERTCHDKGIEKAESTGPAMSRACSGDASAIMQRRRTALTGPGIRCMCSKAGNWGERLVGLVRDCSKCRGSQW